MSIHRDRVRLKKRTIRSNYRNEVRRRARELMKDYTPLGFPMAVATAVRVASVNRSDLGVFSWAKNVRGWSRNTRYAATIPPRGEWVYRATSKRGAFMYVHFDSFVDAMLALGGKTTPIEVLDKALQGPCPTLAKANS